MLPLVKCYSVLHNIHAKRERFYSFCIKKVYCNKQNAKRKGLVYQQTVWQARVSGPLFITSQQTCVNRQGAADKPRTILQTSCSWNACIQWQCKHLFLQNVSLQSRGQLQTAFWPIINMHVQQNTVSLCRKRTHGERGEGICGAHSELD